MRFLKVHYFALKVYYFLNQNFADLIKFTKSHFFMTLLFMVQNRVKFVLRIVMASVGIFPLNNIESVVCYSDDAGLYFQLHNCVAEICLFCNLASLSGEAHFQLPVGSLEVPCSVVIKTKASRPPKIS